MMRLAMATLVMAALATVGRATMAGMGDMGNHLNEFESDWKNDRGGTNGLEVCFPMQMRFSMTKSAANLAFADPKDTATWDPVSKHSKPMLIYHDSAASTALVAGRSVPAGHSRILVPPGYPR